MGGTKSGPQMNGSSLMGRVSARVSAPQSSGASPRSTAASPMVAMITATTGRPMSGRSTTRSRPKPKLIMAASPTATASHRGAP